MNKSNIILLIDPTFDPATAPSCDLLVKIGLDSFSYAIVNKETNEVNAVYDEQECESGAKKFTARLKVDSYLGLPYREVKIAIYTENKIDIPNDFFDIEGLEAYTQYFTAPHTATIYATQQPQFKLTTVFALPKLLEETLQTFKGKKYPLSAGLLALAKNEVGEALHLDFSAHSFSALYVKNGELIFQQTYEIENAEEFNYYFLLLLDQLDIALDTSHICLTGIVHEADEIYRCLQKYVHQIEFTEVPNKWNKSVLDDMPMHYYSSLLALDQCE